MYILGLSLGHDVSVALLKDGKIIAAVQEERLSRIKTTQRNSMEGCCGGFGYWEYFYR